MKVILLWNTQLHQVLFKNWCAISGIHGGKNREQKGVISSKGILKVMFIPAIDEDLATV